MQLEAVVLQGEVLRHGAQVCDGDCVLLPLNVGGLLAFWGGIHVLIRLLHHMQEGRSVHEGTSYTS